MRSPFAIVPFVLAAIAAAPVARAQTTPVVNVEAVALPGTSIPAGRATAEFAVPLAAVEAVINDFGHYHEFLPQVQQSRIVHRRHDQVDLYVQVQLMRNLGTLWALTRFDLQQTADGLIANGVLIDGNLQRFDLRIEAHMIPGTTNTRVSLLLLGVPAFFLPSSLVAEQQPAWAERALSAMGQRAAALAHVQRASR